MVWEVTGVKPTKINLLYDPSEVGVKSRFGVFSGNSRLQTSATVETFRAMIRFRKCWARQVQRLGIINDLVQGASAVRFVFRLCRPIAYLT